MCIRKGNVSDSPELGDYYFDFGESVDSIAAGLYGGFDSEGIPLVDYDRLFAGSLGVNKKHTYGAHYTPVTIAQYGLALYSTHLKHPCPERVKLFLKMADWHVTNLTQMPLGFYVWLHNFEFPIFNLKSPWVSGMAQGQGISLLLRAYQYTDDAKYLDAAHKAFEAFKYGIEDGGVSVIDGDDLWLEEYPNNPATHVLNGFIFALWGVLDYHRATNNSIAKSIYDRCVCTLERNIGSYQGYYWTRYDLIRTGNTSEGYHKIHVLQLEIMAKLTSSHSLITYSQIWRSYLDGKYSSRRLVSRCVWGLVRRVKLLLKYSEKALFRGISAPYSNPNL